MKSIPLTPSGERGSPQATAPVFARIGIVGLGHTGGSIGLAVRRTWPSALVVGVDANDALERAIRSHAIDVGGSDLVMLNGVDLVVLTGTAEQSAEVLAVLDQYVPGPVVVTATFGAPVVTDAARALPSRLTFVAGDLAEAGHSQRDAVSADPGWLADREWRLLPAPDDAAAATAVARLRDFVAALGADPRVVG